MSRIIMVCGVSGSGKTTIGQHLSNRIHVPFYDADAFHPKANIEKMEEGHPLNDEDRQPWLEAMAHAMSGWEQNDGAVLGCSALKEKYRETLQEGASEKIIWIMLEGDFDLIKERMTKRKNHFFDANMLRSQYEAYERPDYGYFFDVKNTPQEIVDSIVTTLKENKELDEL
ncbi:MAG TPA: gluconokinase [Leeuwenhoekiella sp.]|nr:gluconokinase [Leeuwenhoekiella sp.]